MSKSLNIITHKSLNDKVAGVTHPTILFEGHLLVSHRFGQC